MSALLAAAAFAIVAQDQTALRASPHDNAPRQTLLAQGDWLEVRGEQQGYLHVYDHRHERPGYVRPAQVRTVSVEEASAPSLLAVVDFLKDSPGQEALGIGYFAMYLKAAPAAAITADVWRDLGTMADRLAERASARTTRAGDGAVAEELAVAESYGVHFASFEAEGATRVCYDGEAWKRALTLGGAPTVRVKTALGLTDPRCADPGLGSTAALARDDERATVLQAVEASAVDPTVSASDRARLHLRSVMVEADIAFHSARTSAWPAAEEAARAAKRELLLVDRAALADDDRPLYEEAALRTAGVRWADEPPAPASDAIELAIAPGTPGQTCVHLRSQGSKAPPLEDCSYGVVWSTSARVAPSANVVTLEVEPTPGWTELRVYRKSGDAWTVDALPPALVDPDIGYAEVAGFAADGSKLLLVREYRASGPLGAPHTLAPWMTRTFQVVSARDLSVEREAGSLGGLPKSRRWETADWKRGTVALR